MQALYEQMTTAMATDDHSADRFGEIATAFAGMTGAERDDAVAWLSDAVLSPDDSKQYLAIWVARREEVREVLPALRELVRRLQAGDAELVGERTPQLVSAKIDTVQRQIEHMEAAA